ncbi:MAG: hypothetical protein J1F36_02965, partial [Clostridiales bacterium]|nr:hypothetical protein [Clostridiales bacterium]
ILPPDEPIEEPIQEEQQPTCDAFILPPDEPIEEPIQEEQQPACDAVILPPDEPQPIDTQAYETTVLQEAHFNKVQFDKYVREEPKENKTVFYSYKRTVPDVDEASEIIDKEYRGVITKLISDNVVFDEPEPPLQVPDIDYASAEYFKIQPPPTVYETEQTIEPQVPPQSFQQFEVIQPPEQQSQEFSSNNKTFVPEQSDNVDIRTHNDKTIRAYNNKHYYYSNQLRLLQCGILFGVMLLEIIICFYLIEVVHKNMNITPVNLAIYIGAVILAALFPIMAYCMARSDYYKRKRINYSGRSSALFSIASTVLLMLITFFLNVYAGILIGDITNYLSSLILPMVLSTNVIVNAIIFHILYTSGRYNIEE